MESIFEMGTTVRHSRFIKYLLKSSFDLFERNELVDFQESIKLVYQGSKTSPKDCELLNLAIVKDKSSFKSIMNDLGDVEPDYLYF